MFQYLTNLTITMTSLLLQQLQTDVYLNTYFDVFITPRIRALQIAPNIINTNIRYLEETEKREAINKLLADITLYRETNYQSTSDEDDAIFEELAHLLLMRLLLV